VSVYKVDCTRFLDKAFQGHQRKNNEEYPKKGSTIEKNAGDSSSRMKNHDPFSLSHIARRHLIENYAPNVYGLSPRATQLTE